MKTKTWFEKKRTLTSCLDSAELKCLDSSRPNKSEPRKRERWPVELALKCFKDSLSQFKKCLGLAEKTACLAISYIYHSPPLIL